MTCPKCGSSNVSVQAINETQLKNKHHGFLWWLCIGWWWVALKWLMFPLFALLVKIFAPKRQKIKNKHVTMCCCQSCGHSWQK